MTNNLLFSTHHFLSLLLNSCGSNSLGEGEQAFTQQEKKFVHTLFLTEYLWADQVTSNIDYSTFSSPQSLLNELRVTPPDKWSFAMTAHEYDNFVNQKTEGFGFGYKDNFIVFLVRINSPVYGKLFRGDQIIQIDGEEVSQSLIKSLSTQLNKTSIFTVLRNNQFIEVALKPKEYTFKVTQSKVLTQGSKKIGYLRYDSFTGTSVAEFEKAFTTFKNTNIDELVIDLRYNGGGSVVVASTLLENITNAYPGQRQGYLDWNDNYKNKNESFYFTDEPDANDLNMKRVFFLVTKGSASASELVISALKPYLGETNVITIGTNTHGKNVGMRGKTYGSNYYFIINFFVRNNANETTSFKGILPTCSAIDDISHSMGDTNETMLSTALYYIQNNKCP